MLSTLVESMPLASFAYWHKTKSAINLTMNNLNLIQQNGTALFQLCDLFGVSVKHPISFLF